MGLLNTTITKKINQTAGQVAYKSYPSCIVVTATDIAVEV